MQGGYQPFCPHRSCTCVVEVVKAHCAVCYQDIVEGTTTSRPRWWNACGGALRLEWKNGSKRCRGGSGRRRALHNLAVAALAW
jgi:hypothetical protein